MAAARLSNATFADLEALGDSIRAEIIHGAIVEKASSTMEHGRSQLGAGGVLRRRFDRRPGDAGPGDGGLFCHDLVGWRRDRVPERDLVDKLGVLHRAGVPHYWIGNPQEKLLVVHRWEQNGYLIVLTAASGDVVRAEPFDAVELRVDALFGDDDDE